MNRPLDFRKPMPLPKRDPVIEPAFAAAVLRTDRHALNALVDLLLKRGDHKWNA